MPNIRLQFAGDEYDVSGCLDVVFDRLIGDLIAESEPAKMASNTEANSGECRTRILVVDDHAVVRQGLRRLVEAESDLTVCAEAKNAAEALAAVECQEFDMAIVDISLDDVNGLELTAKMKSLRPHLTILVLSVYDGLLYARRALLAGAAGYVAKYEAPEKIITAIHQVLAGKIYVSNSRVARAMPGATSIVGDRHDGRRPNRIHSPESAEHGVPNHA